MMMSEACCTSARNLPFALAQRSLDAFLLASGCTTRIHITAHVPATSSTARPWPSGSATIVFTQPSAIASSPTATVSTVHAIAHDA